MYYFISHVDKLLLGSQLWPIKSRWILVPTFDLLKVVLLRQIHSQLPLIQKDTPWTRKSSDFGAWRAHQLRRNYRWFYKKNYRYFTGNQTSRFLAGILLFLQWYGKPNDNPMITIPKIIFIYFCGGYVYHPHGRFMVRVSHMPLPLDPFWTLTCQPRSSRLHVAERLQRPF